MKINIRIFLIILLFIFFISFSSAVVQTLGTFKQNICVQLVQTCSNCTYNNITSIIYPNSTQITTIIPMNKNGTYYNASFCNTNSLGNYIVNGFGDLDGNIQVWNYDFLINSTGTPTSTGQSIIYFLILGFSTFIFILCLWGAVVIPHSNKITDNGLMDVNYMKYFKWSLGFMSYILFVWILFLAWQISSIFFSITAGEQVLNALFLITSWSIIPIIVIFLWFIIANIMIDKKVQEFASRGLVYRGRR